MSDSGTTKKSAHIGAAVIVCNMERLKRAKRSKYDIF